MFEHELPQKKSDHANHEFQFEHIVHALVAVVDRLVVLHGGALIAEGDPQAVIRSPAVSEIYMGITADA